MHQYSSQFHLIFDDKIKQFCSEKKYDEAIEEAKNLMLPEHNLLRPSDGSPVTTPASKEMALGVYFFTSEDSKIPASETVFSDEEEVIHAFQAGKVELRQIISVRINNKIIETTPGRIVFNEKLPSKFEFVNEAVTSTIIKELFTNENIRYKYTEIKYMDINFQK